MAGNAGWSRELDLWGKGYHLVAGVDEVGRGPLAGPVVAAAVIWSPSDLPDGMKDSKKLSPSRRSELAQVIRQRALAWAIGAASAKYIDRHNIWQATCRAMQRSLNRLPVAPEFVLVDGFRIPHLPWPQEGLIHGDANCASIAAASIIAKVWRDNLMDRFDQRHPQYCFGRNRGYATADHLKRLEQYGPSLHHRRSFSPLRRVE